MVVGRGDCRCGGDYRCGGGCVVGGGPCLHGRCLVLVVMVMLLKDVVLDDFYTGILFILTTVCLWCVFRFHPRSVLVLESFQAGSQLHPFDLFGLGQTAWTDQHQNPADEVSGQVFLSLSLSPSLFSTVSHSFTLLLSVFLPGLDFNPVLCGEGGVSSFAWPFLCSSLSQAEDQAANLRRWLPCWIRRNVILFCFLLLSASQLPSWLINGRGLHSRSVSS